jgi:hypothetical protein
VSLKAAVIGDTVSYRNAKGETMNVIVTGTQANSGAAPAQPAVANSGTGGTLTAATYSYRITRVRGGAESLASTAGTTVVSGGTTNKCTITLPGEAGAQYAIYGRTGGSELFIGISAVGATTFDDTGAVTPAGALPTSDGRIGAQSFHTNQILGLPGTASSPLLQATAMRQTNRYYKRT